jgi:4-alpha-glucanotransferase
LGPSRAVSLERAAPSAVRRRRASRLLKFTGAALGNPVYNWNTHRDSGYHWWVLRALLTHVDVIRLDHFCGSAAVWHVPAGGPTARSGGWALAPGEGVVPGNAERVKCSPVYCQGLDYT